jgi:hypothetical protein
LSSVFTTERRDPINGVARIGDHLYDAFIKAIGALAQVIYVITPDDQREQILNDAILKLKTYLELLDAVAGPGSPTVQPSR